MKIEIDETFFQPLSPQQAIAKKIQAIPTFVIAAINKEIVKAFSGGAVTFLVRDLARAIHAATSDRDLNPSGFLPYSDTTIDEVYSNGWVDTRSLARVFNESGWEVTSDFPGYNENYDATITFEAWTQQMPQPRSGVM